MKMRNLLIAAAAVIFMSTGMANAQVAQWATDFTLQDLDGKSHTLSDHRGDVVMLYFFATWCGPCRSATPKLSTLASEFQPQGVKFYQIAGSENNSANTYNAWMNLLNNWRSTYNPPFPILVDAEFDSSGNRTRRGQVYNAYGEGYIPHTVVIGPKGDILHSDSGYNEGAIRRAIEGALEVPPGKVNNVNVMRGPGTFATLTWDTPVGNDLSRFEIEYGPSADIVTGVHTVNNGSATTTDIDIAGMDVAYFTVRAFNISGDSGPQSDVVKFGFKPVAQLTLNDTMIEAGDRLKVDYRYYNGFAGNADNITGYMLFEVGGQIYFINQGLAFLETPAAFISASMSANQEVEANLLNVSFDASTPLPAVPAAFYFGFVDAQGSLLDLEVAPFNFQ